MLTIEVEDIYFLIGLSRQGDPISLTGSCGGDATTQELINCYYIPGTIFLGVMLLPSGVTRFVIRNIAPSANRSCSSGLNGSDP